MNKLFTKAQRPTAAQTFVAILILLAMVAGAWVNSLLPTTSDIFDRSFVSSEEAKDIGRIEVQSVYGAKKYKGMDTHGVWLIVESKYIPSREPLSPVAEIVDAKDRRARSFYDSSCPLTQPGLTTSCTHVFELDPEAVEGATVRFTRTYTEKAASVIVADLGIDSAKKSEIINSTKEFGDESSF